MTPRFRKKYLVPLLIAWRYIFSKHTLNFITIITSISIAGIAIGVAALIFGVSVFNGFRELTESFLIGFDPHVRVSAIDDTWVRNVDSVVAIVNESPLITATSPSLGGKALGVQDNNLQAIMLQGVHKNEIGRVSGVVESVIAGAFDIEPQGGVAHIVIGIGLADKLGAFPGDTLSLVSPPAIEATITQSVLPALQRAVVSGIFKSRNKEYDLFSAYTSIATTRKLFAAPANSALYIDIRGASASDADAIAADLKQRLPGSLRVETWYDLHSDLYDIMQFERMASFVILSLIILVAVFNVFASLTMTVLEKRSEIGVLKAMGGAKMTILRIFFFESLVIGVIGAFLGIAIGLGVCYGQIYFGWFALDKAKFIVSAIPVSVRAFDVVLIGAVSLGLSLLAGLFPAHKAASLQTAVELIRDD